MTKNITILGLDGSGKSTLVKSILKSSPIDVKDIALINAPNYHEIENAPMSDLSKTLEVFSTVCDQLKSYELKAFSLYLQATLFGVVEKAILKNSNPKLIISQRNPMLDSLVYGDFYVKIIHKAISQSTYEEKIINLLEKNNCSFTKVQDWYDMHTQRLGVKLPFWEFPLEIKRIYQASWEELLIKLVDHYQTKLPDVILYIEVDPNVAMGKIDDRNKDTTQKELHESAENLKVIRDNYERMLTFVKEKHPKIQILRVDAYGENLAKEIWSKIGKL